MQTGRDLLEGWKTRHAMTEDQQMPCEGIADRCYARTILGEIGLLTQKKLVVPLMSS